jgi:hypothetical protein
MANKITLTPKQEAAAIMLLLAILALVFTAILALIVVLWSTPAAAKPNPNPTPAPRVTADELLTSAATTDPCQQHMIKLLTGKLGPQPAWKLNLARRTLRRGLTANLYTRRTTYCPSCSGTHCADGSPVRPGVAAADKSITLDSYIYLYGSGIVKITDRGGAVRVGNGFTRYPETHKVDLWVRSCSKGPGTAKNVRMAILQLAPKPQPRHKHRARR